jgi:predicted RNase H-like HicB family nuclease
MPAEGVAPVMAYTAVCEREGDWWVITVPELESGRVTQARTLDEVPATVADLVATMTGADPASVEVNLTGHEQSGPRVEGEPDASPAVVREEIRRRA